ncbi:MAG: TonB-dependent receptor [Pseudomonadota bacterium]
MESADNDVITVSARRREEDLQSTPVAVSAVAPEQLEAEASFNLQDLQGRVPNLVVQNSVAAIGGFSASIRGVSFEDVERSFEPTVGILIDGVVLGTNSGLLASTFDFESVEVLRGPQGTLFGRNNIGGVINVRRTRPTGEYGFRGRATIAEYGRREYEGILNLPLTERGGIKLFGFSRDYDGFMENTTLNRTVGRNDFNHYGAAIRYDLTDKFEMLLTIERQERDGESPTQSASFNTDLVCIPGAIPGFTSAPAAECGQDVDDLYESNISVQESDISFFQDETDYTLELNWDVSDNATITSITAYRELEEEANQDFDATSVPFFSSIRPQEFDQFTQEVRLAAKLTDRVDVVAGLFYLDSFYSLDQTTDSVLFGDPMLGAGQQLSDAAQDTQSVAVFADFDFSVTDRLRLNVGGRYTYDRKKFERSSELFFPAANFTVPIFDTTTLTDDQLAPGTSLESNGRIEETWDDFSPRISLDYQFTDDIFGYVAWAQGYRAGGFSGRGGDLASSSTPFDPETVNSYEVGFRTEWFDNALRLNGTFFYADYTDKQEEVVVALDVAPFQATIIENAGEADYLGFEADGEWFVSDNFSINATLGWLDAEYDEFLTLDPTTSTLVDQSGLELRRAPEVTYSIGGNYQRNVGSGQLRATAQWNWVDDFFLTIVNDDPNISPGFQNPRGISDAAGILNSSVSYEFDVQGKTITASVFGRNLTDSFRSGTYLPVAGLFTFAANSQEPRSFGGSLAVEF